MKKSINLRNNKICEDGIREMASVLEANDTLISLDIR